MATRHQSMWVATLLYMHGRKAVTRAHRPGGGVWCHSLILPAVIASRISRESVKSLRGRMGVVGSQLVPGWLLLLLDGVPFAACDLLGEARLRALSMPRAPPPLRDFPPPPSPLLLLTYVRSDTLPAPSRSGAGSSSRLGWCEPPRRRLSSSTRLARRQRWMCRSTARGRKRASGRTASVRAGQDSTRGEVRGREQAAAMFAGAASGERSAPRVTYSRRARSCRRGSTCRRSI
jgi:hypothetical protein